MNRLLAADELAIALAAGIALIALAEPLARWVLG